MQCESSLKATSASTEDHICLIQNQAEPHRNYDSSGQKVNMSELIVYAIMLLEWVKTSNIH